MGGLFSRFRYFKLTNYDFSDASKKKTTIEILDDLDKRIKDIEQYGQNTEQRHKKIVGTLIIYSVILYIITAMVFYFYFFPAELYDQLFYITPLLVFPILILFTKKIVSSYYTRKISRNQEKLTTMLQEKKKILDQVTETETYKKAKEILMKFAPDQLKITPILYKQSPIVTDTPKISTAHTLLDAESELRRRTLTSSSFTPNLLINKIVKPVVIGTSPSQGTLTPFETSGKPLNTVISGHKIPLPRPVLSQQRSYIDRLVEYVVGDGPNNRYALICRQCDSHNGMALKEEFEYFAFRCCYCNFWNPARKQKPSAPKLNFDNNSMTPQKLFLQSRKSSENLLQTNLIENEICSNLSDTDSDIEVVEKPCTIPDSDDLIIDDNKSDEIKITESTIKETESNNKKIKKEKMKLDESL